VAVVVTVAAPAAAWPVLAESRPTSAGWCYRDHENGWLWWLPPTAPRVMQHGGRPAVDFVTYRYQGARATADMGRIWGGALLQFALEFPDPGSDVGEARRALGRSAEVRQMVPAVVEAQVVFAGINSPLRAVTSESDEEPDAQAGAWRERSFSLALTPEEAAAVHLAWQEGSLILSVNVAVSAYGYSTRPSGGAEAAPELLPVLVDAVPVTVSAERHPEAFRVLELDATMPLGYTTLELGCTELAEGYGLTDLVRVIAVISAEAVNGDIISQQVRFTDDSAPVQAARFDRAVRLDPGYQVQVVRVYATGRAEQETPRRIEVWQGFEDICSVAASAPAELDPRLLY
jgi:hypothetical protein